MKPIVLVDDDADVRGALGDPLTDEGFHVLAFSDGRAALTHLREQPVAAVILLDWTMPVMSGSEFLEALRSDTLLRELKVVVLTGDARALRSGADVCMEKPVSIEELLRVAREYTA